MCSRRLFTFSSFGRAIALLIVTSFLVTTPAFAQNGQQWTEITEHENPANARQAVPGMRRRGITDAQVFDDHYYFRFEQFTHAETLNELPAMRAALANELRGAADPAAHDRINEIALEVLGRIATDDEFAPASRLNAVLMLGNLNQQEAVIGGGKAVPLAAGVDAMLQAWTAIEGAHDGVSDALRRGLFQGIERHLEAEGLSAPAEQTRAANLMLGIASAVDAPEGRIPETHTFFRARAADILGALGNTGTDRSNADVLDALVKMVAQQDADLYMRAAAATAIGRLDLSNPANLGYSALVHVLGDFAVDATDDEVKARGAMAFLRSIESALRGTANNSNSLDKIAAGEAHKPVIEQFAIKLDEMLAALNDRRATEEDMRSELKTKTSELKQWLGEQQAELRILPNLEEIVLSATAPQ